MTELLTHDEISAVIKEVCETLNVPSLYPKINLRFNHRVARAFGRASISEMTIEICTKLYSASPVAKRRNTIIHETCHLLAYAAYGPNIQPHGKEWKTLMVRMGQAPKARSSFQGMAPGRKRVYCGCGPTSVTPLIFKRMMRNEWNGSIIGTGYRCRKCKQSLKIKAPAA